MYARPRRGLSGRPRARRRRRASAAPPAHGTNITLYIKIILYYHKEYTGTNYKHYYYIHV